MQHCLDGLEATFHLHFVKFDSSGEPKFDTLAKTLVKHIVRYALSMQTREYMKERQEDGEEDEGDLFMKARDLFRKVGDAGETGELLLFFLLESIFSAPQVVCKMELKTNSNDEVKGTDGIHVRWDDVGNRLNVYLGESKLYGELSTAISSIFTSIAQFHRQKKRDHELALVTTNFKHLDDDLKNEVTAFLDDEDPRSSSCRIVHACLVGWSWNKYELLSSDRSRFVAEFKKCYLEYYPNIRKMVADRFSDYEYKHLCYEFIFLPFRNVQEFRDEFYRQLLGGKAS